MRAYQHQQADEEDEFTYDEGEEEAIDDRYEQAHEQTNRDSEEEVTFDLIG